MDPKPVKMTNVKFVIKIIKHITVLLKPLHKGTQEYTVATQKAI
jgi:hypothetical protein